MYPHRNIGDDNIFQNPFHKSFKNNTSIFLFLKINYSKIYTLSALWKVEFKKKFGLQGVEWIFRESIKVNVKDSEDKNLSADTTVQEKNITSLTDEKLYKNVINQCQAIA